MNSGHVARLTPVLALAGALVSGAAFAQSPPTRGRCMCRARRRLTAAVRIPISMPAPSSPAASGAAPLHHGCVQRVAGKSRDDINPYLTGSSAASDDGEMPDVTSDTASKVAKSEL